MTSFLRKKFVDDYDKRSRESPNLEADPNRATAVLNSLSFYDLKLDLVINTSHSKCKRVILSVPNFVLCSTSKIVMIVPKIRSV